MSVRTNGILQEAFNSRESLLQELEIVDKVIALLRDDTTSWKQYEIIAIVERLLRESGELSRDELQRKTKESASKNKERNLSGFTLRFREALNDPRFERAGDKYRLVATHDTETLA